MTSHRVALFTCILGLLTAAPLSAQAAGSLDLLSAIDAALASDPVRSMRAAEADGLLAEVRAERSLYRPTFGLSWSGTRFEEPMPVAPIHGLDPRDAPEFDPSLIQSRIVGSFTLFDGGARRSAVGDASARADAGVFRTEFAAQESIERVARAYLHLLTAREILVAQERRVEALESEQDRVERLVAAGSAPDVERLRAEAGLADAQAAREAARVAVGIAERELSRLTELPLDAIANRRLAPVALRPVPLPSGEEVLGATGVHPLVEAARSGVTSAEARRSAATSAWLPSVSTEAGFNTFGTVDGDFTGEWQLGLTASYAIYSGGARSARAAMADAGIRAAKEQLRMAEDQVERAIEAAWGAWERERARVASLEISVDRYEEVARIEALALSEGVGVQTDFLNAQAALVQARAALAEARNGEIAARIALALARGELSRRWIVDSMNPELPENQP